MLLTSKKIANIWANTSQPTKKKTALGLTAEGEEPLRLGFEKYKADTHEGIGLYMLLFK